MNAIALIEAARSAGLELKADGADLVVRPASLLDPALQAQLAAHKSEVLTVLLGEQPPPAPAACAQCESTAFILSVVDDEGARCCSDCWFGRRP